MSASGTVSCEKVFRRFGGQAVRHWDFWQTLQTTRAYGEHHSSDSLFSARQREIAGGYLGVREEMLLAIGPGGPPEAQWLLGHVIDKNHLCLLTAHGPEVVALAAVGFAANGGDMHEMPFSSGTFNTVFSSNVLEHALAPYIALMEARRVAAFGALGYFIVPSFGGDEGGVGPFHVSCLAVEHWTDLMAKTGWHVVERYDQTGDSTIHTYHHFRCVAVEPKDPHAAVLRDLIKLRAT